MEGSKEFIKLKEELIEWSIMGRVQWESGGLMVYECASGWVPSLWTGPLENR